MLVVLHVEEGEVVLLTRGQVPVALGQPPPALHPAPQGRGLAVPVLYKTRSDLNIFGFPSLTMLLGYT